MKETSFTKKWKSSVSYYRDTQSETIAHLEYKIAVMENSINALIDRNNELYYGLKASQKQNRKLQTIETKLRFIITNLLNLKK